MAVEILDGTIDATEPLRSKGKFAVFEALRFRDRKGVERNLTNICTGGDITGALRKGGTGKFYVSSGGGQTGIHGVRLDNGTQAYAHYNNMEFIVTIGIAAAVASPLIGMVTGNIMVWPVLIGVLLVAIYFFLRSIRLSGKQQYDADKA